MTIRPLEKEIAFVSSYLRTVKIVSERNSEEIDSMNVVSAQDVQNNKNTL